MPATRREVLYQIALSVAAPGLAAQQHPLHKPAGAAAPPAGRRVFTEREFKTLQALSDWIIPPDERSVGGMAAGTAEFIDLMAGVDPKLAASFTGGVAWLDRAMRRRHGKPFLECSRGQQNEMLGLLAYRSRATGELAPGGTFFALLRAWTVDAFYTSKAGIADLGFVGNAALAEFNGCPDEVVEKLLKNSPAL